MTVARYIALSLISRYLSMDPTNRDISGLHCIRVSNFAQCLFPDGSCLFVICIKDDPIKTLSFLFTRQPIRAGKYCTAWSGGWSRCCVMQISEVAARILSLRSFVELPRAFAHLPICLWAKTLSNLVPMGSRLQICLSYVLAGNVVVLWTPCFSK